MREPGVDEVDGGPEPLGARPYQAVAPSGIRPAAAARDAMAVRPYVVTGGRTRSSNALVGFETMVSLSPAGVRRRGEESSERRAILDRCTRPISVVELSAHLGVPLGVAQVLAGDLADEALLLVHEAPTMPSTDRSLLERLARAVQNKQREVA